MIIITCDICEIKIGKANMFTIQGEVMMIAGIKELCPDCYEQYSKIHKEVMTVHGAHIREELKHRIIKMKQEAKDGNKNQG